MWEFSRRSVAIFQHIRNIKRYRLYAHDSPDGALSNHGSEIAELILWIEILNLKKK